MLLAKRYTRVNPLAQRIAVKDKPFNILELVVIAVNGNSLVGGVRISQHKLEKLYSTE